VASAGDSGAGEGVGRIGAWVVAGFILLVSLGLALSQSHVRPIEPDEMYGFFTAAEPTAAAVMHTQLTAPISLDPPTYQLLSHWTIGLVGPNALGARLPSIVGFLLMQLGLFVFVRRLGGVWAGWFAMLFPMATYSFHYAAQGRPYGLLLGCYGVALACWQGASRRGDGEAAGRGRTWLLVGLAAALVVAITSHYFGLLILIPLCAAEGVRTLVKKRLDWGVLAALGAGVVAVGTLVPFKKAVTVYRAHYYTKMIGVRAISLAYRRLFLDYPESWGVKAQRDALIALTVLVQVLVWAAWRRYRTRPVGEPLAEWAGIAVLAALPFFGYAFAVVVTKTMEVRYVMPAVLGMTILLALGLRPVFRSKTGAVVVLGVMAALVVGNAFWAAAVDRESRAAMLREMAEVQAGEASGQALYTADMGKFVTHWYYADGALRQRLTYCYSQEREIALMQHDVNYLTAVYMARMAPAVRVAPWETVKEEAKAPAGILVVEYPALGWDWIPLELAADGAEATPMGDELGGQLVRVRLR
jgi:hypothetical protein